MVKAAKEQHRHHKTNGGEEQHQWQSRGQNVAELLFLEGVEVQPEHKARQ